MMRTIKTYSKRAPFYNALIRLEQTAARRTYDEYRCQPAVKFLFFLFAPLHSQASYTLRWTERTRRRKRQLLLRAVNLRSINLIRQARPAYSTSSVVRFPTAYAKLQQDSSSLHRRL